MAIEVTRYPHGVNNVNADNMLANFALPFPLNYHIFSEDFDYYVSGADGAGSWTGTNVGTNTLALTALDGGVFRITTTSTANDLAQIQTKAGGFMLSAGKEAYFATRFKIASTTFNTIFLGLGAEETTSNFYDGSNATWNVTDCVGFRCDISDGNLDFMMHKNDNETALDAVAALTDDTWCTVGFYWDGAGNVKVYTGSGANLNTYANAVTGTTTPANWPDDVALLPTVFGETGSANNPLILDVDYIFVAKER